LCVEWRAEFDDLYNGYDRNMDSDERPKHNRERAKAALSLLLFFFDKNDEDDKERLLIWMSDACERLYYDAFHLNSLFKFLLDALTMEIESE